MRKQMEMSTHLVESFMERMAGGAFIYRASEDHEILFANQYMIRLFECEDYDDFMDFVGGSFDGIVNEGDLEHVNQAIDHQIENTENQFDHVFYNIRTKNGNIRFLEDYGALVHDPVEGDIFYVYVMEHPATEKETNYVLENLDAALRNGWIQVYYQPVVRALTEKLCSVESLARWVDPDMGFIPPNEFIPILESANLIHKLDCFVVEQVCRDLREAFDEGRPVVPVSINFSRLDFVLCDMLDVLEKAVETYQIPREFIHIEITESMIVSDEELMQNVIQRFRSTGYEIWMDDFGSGYSSLNLLKDYQFDLLKFDMRFLRPFTEKAKDIMRSAVVMVKDIGVKTLAEGVETKEQLDFLREIGCGKIQGYYFGKPLPKEEYFINIKEKDIQAEEIEWHPFYEMASFRSKYTKMPLELIVDDGENFHTLFMNESYREEIGMRGMSLQEIDTRIYQTPSPLLTRYRSIATRMEKNGTEESVYYVANGCYYFLKGKVIAQKKGKYLIEASIHNLGRDEADRSQRLDKKLRELNQLFDMVFLLDLKKGTMIPIMGKYHDAFYDETLTKNLKAIVELTSEKGIHPEDREKYKEFLNIYTLIDRIMESKKGYISQVFRVKTHDEVYEKKEITLMTIGATKATEYLYCIKDYVESN